MTTSMMYFQPSSTLPATYRLPTGVDCEIYDHDLTSVGFRVFLSALTNALAFSCCRSPSPEVMCDHFNRDQALLSGWYVIRSTDKELTCDIAEYDVGTYSRFCLDHKYLYVVFRRHDPTFMPAPMQPPSDQEVSDEDMQSIDSVRADEEDVAIRSPKGKRRVAMRWTAADLDNLRAGVAQFGKDWHAILNTYDFRGRNTRALSERWHRLTAEMAPEEAKPDQGGEDVMDENQTRRSSLPAPRSRGKRGGARMRRASAPESFENGDRSHICATQRFYTEKEEQNLREGVAKYGQDWGRILAEYWGDNPDRSTKSLAKKWRVLSGLIEAETDDRTSDGNPDEGTLEESRRRRRSATAGGEPATSPTPESYDNDNIAASKRTRRSSGV